MDNKLTLNTILLEKINRWLNPNFNQKVTWLLLVSGIGLVGYQRIIGLMSSLEYIDKDIRLKLNLTQTTDYTLVSCGLLMVSYAFLLVYNRNKDNNLVKVDIGLPTESVLLVQNEENNNNSSLNSKATIKLGLIGVGQSTGPQFTAIKNVPSFEFIYFSDTNKMIRDELNTRGYHKATFNTEYKEMLHVDGINAIVVATELKNHYEHAKDVLNAGKNLLLEKPATLYLNQLRELIKISENNNLCFVCSLHAAFDKTIDWILDKENIVYLRDQFGWNDVITKIKCEFYDPYVYENSTTQKNRFISLNDSWLDSGINALSVIGRIVSPEMIYYKNSSFGMCSDPLFKDRIVDAEVQYSFNSFGEISIHTSWIKNINRKVTILTNSDNMELTLDHTAQKISININNSNYDVIVFDQNRLVNQYISLYKDFYMHINKGTNNLAHALKLHELLFEPVQANNLTKS